MNKIEFRFELDISWNFDNVVILVTELHDDSLVLDYWQRQEISLFSKMCRLTVGPTQLPGAFSRVKLQGHEFDHLLLSSDEVENGWSYIFVLHVCLYNKYERKIYLFISLFIGH
jgi:hypothetical protein